MRANNLLIQFLIYNPLSFLFPLHRIEIQFIEIFLQIRYKKQYNPFAELIAKT